MPRRRSVLALAGVGAAVVVIVPLVIGLTSQPEEGAAASQSPAESASSAASDVPLPPSAIPAPTPTPAPSPVPGYVVKDGLPFAVIDSVAADSLFDAPDTCTNPVDGYELTYPDGWYTNTQVADVPHCSWFSPTSYELTGESWPPTEIVIVIDVFPGGYGAGYYIPTFAVDEVIAIGGFEGQRRELIAGCFKPEGCRALPPSYTYDANLGLPDAMGPWFVAGTSSEGVADYELNKAVLDRIMASLEFFP